MAEIRTVATLRSKRDEILASIKLYEKRLAQARADLSHVTACIAIFEASGELGAIPSYIDTHRMFARGELIALGKQSLASGPKTTKGTRPIHHGGEGPRHRRQGTSARHGDVAHSRAAATMAAGPAERRRQGQGRAGLGVAALSVVKEGKRKTARWALAETANEQQGADRRLHRQWRALQGRQ
jgi:hypothetical protein